MHNNILNRIAHRGYAGTMFHSLARVPSPLCGTGLKRVNSNNSTESWTRDQVRARQSTKAGAGI